MGEEPLAFYNKREQEAFPDPDDEDLEQPAGREMRLLQDRRRKAREDAEALEKSSPIVKKENVQRGTMSDSHHSERNKYPEDEEFAKKWDGPMSGCNDWWCVDVYNRDISTDDEIGSRLPRRCEQSCDEPIPQLEWIRAD